MKNLKLYQGFSICFATEGGHFSFGDSKVLYNWHFEDDSHFSIHKKENDASYYTSLYSISIDKDEFLKNEDNQEEPIFKDVIIDSASTLMYVPRREYQLIAGKIKTYCTRPEKCGDFKMRQDLCFFYNSTKYTNIQDFFKTFPTFNFKLGKSLKEKVILKPEQYFFEDYPHWYCMPFDALEYNSK